MKLLQTMITVIAVCLVSESAFSHNFKDIKHQSFSMRVPVEWTFIGDGKSVSYAIDDSGGTMDVRFWRHQYATQASAKIEKQLSDKRGFEKKQYILGVYDVTAFLVDIKGKKGTIRQNINFLQANQGFYLIQFSTNKKRFNAELYKQSMITFSSAYKAW